MYLNIIYLKIQYIRNRNEASDIINIRKASSITHTYTDPDYRHDTCYD